jgi:hypothetical protein
VTVRRPLFLLGLAAGCSSPHAHPRTARGQVQPAPPDAGAPPAPDPDAVRAEAAHTTGDPASIRGYAQVPRDQLSGMDREARGKVTARTAAAPVDDRVRWTLVVSDAAGRDHRYAIELPDGIAMPAALGAVIDVRAGHHGGGPNVIATIVITDDAGSLLLAINQLPDGWSADLGRRLSTERGDPYDEHHHAARITAPRGRAVELVTTWRAVELGGARFYGSASAARRVLKPRRPAPPDYVGGWIDLALVRVDR